MRSTLRRLNVAERPDTTLLSNVHVVDPRGRGKVYAGSSIEISSGRIQRVGTSVPFSNSAVVDLRGAFALPGFIAGSCLSQRMSANLLFPLYLGSGVTTAVLPLPPNVVRFSVSDVMAWSDRVSQGELAGPALSVSGGSSATPYAAHAWPSHVAPFSQPVAPAVPPCFSPMPDEIAQGLEPLIGAIGLSPSIPRYAQSRFAQLSREMTALALSAGVDLSNREVDCTVVHGRMLRLQRGGLSPAESISAFTHQSALQHGLEAGLIQAGLAADLVILSANPLDNVENATQIVGVVQGGRLYTAHMLEAMLTQARNHAHRLRLSCNFLRRNEADSRGPLAAADAAPPLQVKTHRGPAKKMSIRRKISNRVALSADLPYLRG